MVDKKLPLISLRFDFFDRIKVNFFENTNDFVTLKFSLLFFLFEVLFQLINLHHKLRINLLYDFIKLRLLNVKLLFDCIEFFFGFSDPVFLGFEGFFHRIKVVK
jgi:hypothetical protein